MGKSSHSANKQQVDAYPLHSDIRVGSKTCLTDDWKVASLPSLFVRIVQQAVSHDDATTSVAETYTSRCQHLQASEYNICSDLGQ